MRFTQLLVALSGLSIVLLSGCGGGGGSSATTRSAFAGTWSGPYTGTFDFGGGLSGTEQGVFTADVQYSGRFAGSTQDAGGIPGSPQPFSGTIDSKGNVSVTYTSNQNGPASVYKISGTVTKSGTQLTGTLTETVNGGPFETIAINLTQQSTTP